MGERHHMDVCYDGSSEQSGGGLASMSHAEASGKRRPDEDILGEEKQGIYKYII